MKNSDIYIYNSGIHNSGIYNSGIYNSGIFLGTISILQSLKKHKSTSKTIEVQLNYYNRSHYQWLLSIYHSLWFIGYLKQSREKKFHAHG